MSSSSTPSEEMMLPRGGRWLVEPSRHVTEVGERRTARLLSTMLLVLLSVVTIVVAEGYREDPTFWLSVGGLLVLFGLYGLSRTRWYVWSARHVVVFVQVMTVVIILAGGSANPGSTLSLLIVALFLASIFLSVWEVLLAGLLNGVLLLWIFLAAYDLISPGAWLPLVAFQGLAAVLAVLALYHRNAVEKVRQLHLQRSEARFRLLVERVTVAVFIYSADGQLRYANPAAAALSGYTQEDLLGMNVADILPSGKKDTQERQLKTKTHGTRWVEYVTTDTTFEGRDAVLGTAFDVTERRKARELLHGKMTELETFQQLVVGRELKMAELKKEIERLKKKTD